MEPGGDNIPAALARIEGLQGVANERLNNIQGEVTGVRVKLHDLANDVTKIDKRVSNIETERSILVPEFKDYRGRVGILETWRTDTEGRRSGIHISSRLAWGLLIGLLGSGGGIVALVEYFK